ncbi:MAG: GDSL-type esterase/lipase family protein [Acidobacteriota bacterium]
MKCSFARLLVAALLCAVAAAAQQRGPLSNKNAFELYTRAVQLMGSTALAVPELSRAGAPIAENARASVDTMRSLGRQHAGVTYTFLTNARAYLLLADSLPKPDAFPAEGARQLAELRDIIDRAEANFRALLDAKESQLRNPDRDELARYAEANAKLPPPVPGRPRVVFLGDSITDGWRLNEYFTDRDFVNRGISGQTTGEMLGRMQADVIALRPDAMLILAGTNDIARNVPLKIIEDNLSMIADIADHHKVKLLVASVLPISDYHKDKNPAYEMSRVRPPASIRALNDWIQDFCRRRNYVYVDYFTPLADARGFLKAELADDGLHPNAAGYRIMAPVALAAIDKVIPPPGAGKSKRGK